MKHLRPRWAWNAYEFWDPRLYNTRTAAAGVRLQRTFVSHLSQNARRFSVRERRDVPKLDEDYEKEGRIQYVPHVFY